MLSELLVWGSLFSTLQIAGGGKMEKTKVVCKFRDLYSNFFSFNSRAKQKNCKRNLCQYSSEINYTRKSPLMIICFFLMWSFALVLYGPKLWQILTISETALEATLLLAFSVFHIIFWMLAAYYVAVVIFSFLSRPLPAMGIPEDEMPEVAILYTTCNDFCAEAAESCLNQDYPNFHVFLLDDSTKEEIRAEVDAFHAAHPDKTTIVRRNSRQGFKSGALNHALRSVAAKYPFFAVVDADEKLPANFLKRTIVYMYNSDLAFVQANHAPNPRQNASFAKDIGQTILPFWDVHCRARNRYGFVVFVGHGAVVRCSA